MKRPTCRPRVEELELRSTLSATAALLPTLPAVLALPGHVSHPPATGMLSGNYTACTSYTVGQVSGDTNYYISVTSIDPNQHVGVCCLNQFHSFFRLI